jgi:hypothetical protein
MPELLRPPLRLTILSSSDAMATSRARELERILDSTASGIGWHLGNLESPPLGAQPLGEKLELKVFSSAPPGDADAWLDATLHSVVIVLVDQKLFEDLGALDWLRACARHINPEEDRHLLVAVPFGELEQQKWIAASEAFAEYQTLSWMTLDSEPAGRADQLALHVLHAMIRVLATAVYRNPDWRLRLFLSHAKLDGFYLAQSLRGFLGQQSWLGTFYDARDIEPGASWKRALRQAAGRSVLLALRTDIYEQRLWCRQEFRWAEVFGVPRVVVEARSSLVYPASELALDGAPTVRIPDGNLARVLFAALQTALRSLLFQRRVRELQQTGRLPTGKGVKVLNVAPSIETLTSACQELGGAVAVGKRKRSRRLIIYPDPPLAEGLGAAGEALARGVGARLKTPGQLASEGA